MIKSEFVCKFSVVCLAVVQESDLASVIVGLIQVVFTAVAALIMDRAGRKVLLIISGVLTRFYFIHLYFFI